MMQPRIILLEDDAVSRKLFTIFLQHAGYEVIAAPDPTLCPLYADLAQACTHTDACGDFLLTDKQMPFMSGLDFVELQCSRGCKGVVNNKAVISANWDPEEIQRAEGLGCKIFHKPFRIQEVLGWLKEREGTILPDRKLVNLG